MSGAARTIEPRAGAWLAATTSFLAFTLSIVTPADGQHGGKGANDQPLPRGMVIDIDAPGRSLYKVAIADLSGESGAAASEVIRNDLRLSSLFTVLDPRSFIEKQASTAIDPAAWNAVGAQGVVKGDIKRVGASYQIDMRLFELARGQAPILTRVYRGPSTQHRDFMHQFANDILFMLTGERGVFGTKLTFARRIAPGRKDVFVADFDGHGVSRVSRGRGVAMLPNFGPGGIWYSILTKAGMFLTRSGLDERPAMQSSGLNMGVTACGGRMYFSSTRDGNSEIYSAQPDGSDVKRLTRTPAIDVSPACGPGGQIAFVSSRHGSPQIFVMDAQGGGAKRVTFRGSYNQTPAWCPRADKSLIAFTGRDGGTDVFTVNTATGDYKRLTQGQGTNKDPAFSPDCRMVAFASSRGGIFISNPDGLNQQLVIKGAAETVRWSR